MAFLAAMDQSHAHVRRGENGTVEYTAEGVGEARVALSFALVRNTPKDRVVSLMNDVLAQQTVLDEATASHVIADLFVLSFQTRDCRGGKGEKALFDEMLLHLFKQFPQTVNHLLPMIPKFGCYKDIFRILNNVAGDAKYQSLRSKLIQVVVRRLQKDDEALKAWEKLDVETRATAPLQLSLCAKFAPREGKALSKGAWFEKLKTQLFPSATTDLQRKVLYRKLVVRLTAALDVPEVKMSSHHYSDIDFNKVPSICLNKFRKAFLNEKVKGKDKNEMDDETGNRFPEDPDRVECRKHLRESIANKGVKGKQLQPHELVVQCMKKASTLEIDLFNAQWVKIREDLERVLQEKATPAEGAIDFRKLVPMVDVSGSMSGDPMHAAIGLGILTSEVNHPLFRNRFITFETDPSWVVFKGTETFHQKVQITKNASWGGSTDIDKAFKMILDIVKQHKLPASEVPDLIIFSDMQFDVALGGQQNLTQLEKIKKQFAEAGKKISGSPYPAPRIVFWNLRGDTHGFPSKANTPNVQMLSGFSASLLKLALSGEPVEKLEKDADGNAVAAEVTPYETFRRMVDDERYNIIRLVLNKSKEGILRSYTFELPPAIPTEGVTNTTTTTDAAAMDVDGEKKPAAHGAVVVSPEDVMKELAELDLDTDWDIVEMES